jgi:hypothetical protein
MANPHWSLFEVIDEDLHAFSREVEFSAANFSTYSVTLVRLYLSICSEVDVIAKLRRRHLYSQSEWVLNIVESTGHNDRKSVYRSSRPERTSR